MAALTRLLAVLAAASALRINPLKAVTKLRGAKAGGAKRVVVAGNGMVGQRFVELGRTRPLELGLEGDLEIVSFCEEPVAAYDRVKLTSWFETRRQRPLAVGKRPDGREWYEDPARPHVKVRVGDKASAVDAAAKTVLCGDEAVPYDACIDAGGHAALASMVEDLGLEIHCDAATKAFEAGGTPRQRAACRSRTRAGTTWTRDGATYLKGGILVGDAEDYGEPRALEARRALADAPALLLAPLSSRAAPPPRSTGRPGKQICSCNGVSRGDIVDVVAEVGDACDYAKVKKCTRARPAARLRARREEDPRRELEKLGATVFTGLCSHFDKSAPELKALLRLDDECDTFEDAIAKYGPRRVLLHRARIPAGEVTPAGLMALGAVVADEYGLYCKITARSASTSSARRSTTCPRSGPSSAPLASRAPRHGKALRMVKSCVGSSWCRYGVQNSVDFAVTVENRYKGLRAPHKLKSAVSGCIARKRAEAQCKDFGMIATEHGYDLYVCGNGGLNPRHAALLATGIDEATVLKHADRFLMYYACSRRTSSSARRRAAARPTGADGEAQTNWRPDDADVFARSQKAWLGFGPVDDYPSDIGTAILYGETQLSAFKLADGQLFVTQNMCPHKQAFVLSQGLVGDADGLAKVACPLHKKTFGLADGRRARAAATSSS
ncbi:NADH-dependent monodehydroascorbate reductase [Aureococcus anophagefferens]|uniref:NADH-dependent monodehydroascorbate reductase n=1 Tax=Aureococcus anophagefferens TaxID=44056 RepID=A0ABR1FM84_AURAN